MATKLIIGIILNCLSLIALYALGRKHPRGWLLNAGVNTAWASYALYLGIYAFAFSGAVYSAVSILNYLRWING